jgi:hypothetical protein
MASASGSEPTLSSQRMVTSLDLGRKKWAKLSQRGRALLSSIVNARSQLDYVGSSANWASFSDCAVIRERVEASLLQTRRDRSSELVAVLDGLQAVVRAMREAVDDHRARVSKEAARRADPSTAPLIAHAEEAVKSFERELELRRELALELTSPPPRLCAGPFCYCGRATAGIAGASLPCASYPGFFFPPPPIAAPRPAPQRSFHTLRPSLNPPSLCPHAFVQSHFPHRKRRREHLHACVPRICFY